MTWMTPFDAVTSGFVTLALFTYTEPFDVRIRTDFPFTVLTDLIITTSELGTLPATTWYRSTARSFALFFARDFRVDFGTLLNAASVGAKTVYGPDCESVAARPAFVTSYVRVLKFPAAWAVWTMFLFSLGRAVAGAPATEMTRAVMTPNGMSFFTCCPFVFGYLAPAGAALTERVWLRSEPMA